MSKMALIPSTALAILLITGVVLAQEEAPKVVNVTITGVNISLLETYGEGAEAGEGVADLNALKVTSVTGSDGKAIEGLEGKVLAYVPTKAAQALITGKENAGKTVTVEGTLYEAGVLSISTFTAAAEGDFILFEEKTVEGLSGKQVL